MPIDNILDSPNLRLASDQLAGTLIVVTNNAMPSRGFKRNYSFHGQPPDIRHIIEHIQMRAPEKAPDIVRKVTAGLSNASHRGLSLSNGLLMYGSDSSLLSYLPQDLLIDRYIGPKHRNLAELIRHDGAVMLAYSEAYRLK